MSNLVKNYGKEMSEFINHIPIIDKCPKCNYHLTVAERLDKKCWNCGTYFNEDIIKNEKQKQKSQNTNSK